MHTLIWEQYKRTLPIVQAFILLMSAVMHWAMKTPNSLLLRGVLMMEIGGVLGAWWAVRLKMRMERESGQTRKGK